MPRTPIYRLLEDIRDRMEEIQHTVDHKIPARLRRMERKLKMEIELTEEDLLSAQDQLQQAIDQLQASQTQASTSVSQALEGLQREVEELQAQGVDVGPLVTQL